MHKNKKHWHFYVCLARKVQSPTSSCYIPINILAGDLCCIHFVLWRGMGGVIALDPKV